MRTLHTLHFVKQLLAALGGNDVALAVPCALLCNIRLLARDLLLLILPMFFGNFAIDAALLHALGVVAAIKLCAVMLNRKCFVGHLIQKVTVVRNDHHALGVGDKKALKPRQRFNIQMVCRLVEEQNVRLACKLNCKGEARALTARKC